MTSQLFSMLGGSIAAGMLAVCPPFDPQVQLPTGQQVPNWMIQRGAQVQSVGTGWGGFKLVMGLASVAGFAGTILLSRRLEDEADRLDQELAEREAEAAQEREFEQQRQQQIEAAKLKAHEVFADEKAAEYFYEMMGISPEFAAQAMKPAEPPHQQQQQSPPDGDLNPAPAATQAAAPAPEALRSAQPVQPTESTQPAQSTAPSATAQRELIIPIGQSPDGATHNWQPSQQSNGFMVALGSSGSGKTETLKAINAEVHRFGIPVLILDFHGDVAVDGIRTLEISHNPKVNYSLNPLELDSLDPSDGGIYAHINVVLEMIQLAVPSFGHQQRRVLKAALEAAYRACGMKDSDPSTWSQPAPKFSTVLKALYAATEDPDVSPQSRATAESTIAIVEKVFEHPAFNKPECISAQQLLAQSTRLELSHLEYEAMFIAADTILRKVARALKSQGSIPVQPKSDRERYRLFATIDEAKLLTMRSKQQREDPKAIVNKLTTEWRKYGLGGVFASQRADHFGADAMGQFGARLALRPELHEEAKNNAPNFGLSPDELLALNGKGDGYLKLGASPAVRVQVAPLSARNIH